MYGDREGVPTRQVVAIESVSTTQWMATGITRYGSRISINLDFMWAGILIVPSLGEQWLVEKYLGSFVLVGRVGFQDERRLLDLNPGDTVLGHTGKTYLFGEEVSIESEEGLTSDSVNLTSPPTATLFTTESLPATRLGVLFLEEYEGDHHFDTTSGTLIPRVEGVYLTTLNFYQPGSVKLYVDSQVLREFGETSSVTVQHRLTSGQRLTLEYVPKVDIPKVGARVNASLTTLWVSH